MKKMLFILLVVGSVVSATACGKTQTEAEPATQSTTIAATATAPVTTEATQEETSQTEQPHTVEMQIEERLHTEENKPQEEQNMTLQMTIGSTPVAMGSKVPACPIFFIFKILRILATAPKEVMPAGLSIGMMPVIRAFLPPLL